jgi:hypothetical protein
MIVSNNSGYQNAIQNYIEIFNVINESDSNLLSLFMDKVSIDGSLCFSEKIINSFSNISKHGPGRELMHRLINSGESFTVKEETMSSDDNGIFYQTGCKAFPLQHLLIFRFDETHYTLTINQDGDKELYECPIEVVLFHEFKHLVDHFENPKSIDLNKLMFPEQHLIDPEFDDEDEQSTISGLSFKTSNLVSAKTIFSLKSKNDEVFVLADPCCENSLLKSLGYPMRINHQAKKVPLGNSLNIIDIIALNALGNLKPLLLKSPELLNDFHSHPTLPKITLLSAAAFYAQSESVEFLLSKGAKIDQEDEMGGALMAAIKGSSRSLSENWIHLAYKLLEGGANILMKDTDGKTALDLFEPVDRFCIKKKPLIKCLKKAQKEALNLL